MQTKPHDPVNHPKHYTSHPSGVECIEITEGMPFCLGNAVKYLWRAGKKGPSLEDLRKARWYIVREIERLKRLGPARRLSPVVPDDASEKFSRWYAVEPDSQFRNMISILWAYHSSPVETSGLNLVLVVHMLDDEIESAETGSAPTST